MACMSRCSSRSTSNSSRVCHLATSTLLLAFVLVAQCTTGALASNTGPVTVQSSSGQSIQAGGLTIDMGGPGGISTHPTAAGPAGITNTGPVTIQGATVGAVKVGRKLSEQPDFITGFERSPELFPSAVDGADTATAALQAGRRLAQSTTVLNTGNVAIQGGASGTTNIGRKMLQSYISNSGPVTIQGGSIGDVNVGRKMLQNQIRNSGPVTI